VLVGSFLEEVISPIPSFVVLIPTGLAAQVQQVPLWYLPILALLAAAGRLGGAIILYMLADKFEDVILGNNRRFFGMTHAQVERLGHRFGKSTRNWTILFMMNAVPVIPVALLSLTCGFIRLHFRTFVTATFLGTAVSALFYISLGYAGIQAAGALENLELASQITAGLIAVAVVAGIIWYRKKRR